MGENKVQHMRLGPGKHLHGLTLPGGIPGEEFDYFHGLFNLINCTLRILFDTDCYAKNLFLFKNS